MLNLSNFYPKIKGLFYVVNPTPMGVGDLKSENPGVPGGGGFTILKTPGTRGWGIEIIVGFPKPYLCYCETVKLLKSQGYFAAVY